MKKVRINFLSLVLVLLVLIMYSFAFYLYNIPQRNSSYDYYSIIGTTNALKSNLINEEINYQLFPYALINSMHTNLQSVEIVSLQTVLGIDVINTSFIIGIINIILFYFAFYYFLSFFPLKRKVKIIILIFTLIISNSSPSYSNVGSTLVSIPDILIGAFTFQIVGYSLLFILSRQIFEYLNNGKKSRLILILILGYLLFNIHLYVYFMMLFIVTLYITTQYKIISDKTRIATLSFVGIAVFFLILLWPFGNYIKQILDSTILFQQGAIALGSKSYVVNLPFYYISLLSFSIIGYLFLFKEKNQFFRAIILGVTVLICISLLDLPFKLPGFWRFSLILKLALIIVLVGNMFVLSVFSYKRMNLIILFAVVLLCLFFASNMLDLLVTRTNDYSSYQQIKNLNLEKRTILSDDITSNMIQAVPTYSTFIIPEGHVSNPQMLITDVSRIKNIIYLLSNSTDSEFRAFLVSNKIDYILLNNNINSEFNKRLLNYDWSNYTVIYNNQSIIVINSSVG